MAKISASRICRLLSFAHQGSAPLDNGHNLDPFLLLKTQVQDSSLQEWSQEMGVLVTQEQHLCTT